MKDNRKQDSSITRQVSSIAFTLIELLVVIAIISILASLLLPALKNARNLSKKIYCSNNLHQLGISTINYSIDYNDFIPNSMTYNDWRRELLPYTCPNMTNTAFNAISYEYKGTPFNCPNVDQDPIPQRCSAMNTRLNDLSGATADKISSIRHPSDTLIIGEQMGSSWFTTEAPGGFSYRHGRRTNVLFADSHVNDFSFTEIGSKTVDIFIRGK